LWLRLWWLHHLGGRSSGSWRSSAAHRAHDWPTEAVYGSYLYIVSVSVALALSCCRWPDAFHFHAASQMGGRGFFFCFPVGLFRGSERQLGTGNEGGSRLAAPALFSGLKYYNLRGLPAPLCFSFHERALISPLVGRRRHGELYAEAGGLVGFYFCGQKPGSPVSTLDYITTLDAGGGSR